MKNISAGILSREAARYTENFVFTVGLGDDLVMRLSVDSAENLRTKIMQTIHATKLPKVLISFYQLYYGYLVNYYCHFISILTVSYYVEWIWLCFIRSTYKRLGIHMERSRRFRKYSWRKWTRSAINNNSSNQQCT